MLFLENGRLRIHVLDPVADRSRLGTRYCTGGFIFQVEDLERGAEPVPCCRAPRTPMPSTSSTGRAPPMRSSPRLPRTGAGRRSALASG